MLENKLAEIRGLFDMSQRSLAALLGITHGTVRNYENGVTSISFVKAVHYAKELWRCRYILSDKDKDRLYNYLKWYLEVE